MSANKYLIYVFLTVALTCGTFCISAQSTETPDENTKSKSLEELIVVSERSWIDGDKFVFIPSRQEKNLATDLNSLISLMSIPVLSANNGGQITTLNGTPVTVFINGSPADGNDLSTFWPKNALRIEYLETPSDPAFRGARNVVNVIVKEYRYGGLTRIDGTQYIPGGGYYQASSKLALDKVTFNALFYYHYQREHSRGSSESENYRDINYDGKHYESVNRFSQLTQSERNNNLCGGLNSRYKTKNISITHSVQVLLKQDAGSSKQGTTVLDPVLFPGDSYQSRSKGSVFTPSVSGNYFFLTPSQWAFTANWNYSHTRTSRNLNVKEGLTPQIVNDVTDDADRVSASVFVAKRIRQAHDVRLKLSETRDFYNSTYSGYTDSHQKQHHGETGINLEWMYKAPRNLYFYLSPGLNVKDWKVNALNREVQLLPGINANVSWSPDIFNNLLLNVSYYCFSADASKMTDLTLRHSQLQWIKGNPKLKSTESIYMMLTYTRLMSRTFDFSANLSYENVSNSSYLACLPASSNEDGVFMQWTNLKRQNHVMAMFASNINIPKAHLKISPRLKGSYTDYDNVGFKHIFTFDPTLEMMWRPGKIFLRALYVPKHSSLTECGTKKVTMPHTFSLTFGYGVGNLNITAGGSTTFAKRNERAISVKNGVIDSYGRSWNNGNNLFVRLTYTFDYGRKIQPVIDIKEEDTSTTSSIIAK